MMVTVISLPANTGYDLSKDFAPVGLIASTTPMVYTRSTSPAAINSNAPPWDGGP
jgi:hypothetical protein